MKTRFGGAVEAASRGDVAGFASALKRSGYYTASETDYARGLASLMRAPEGGGAPAAAAASPRAVHTSFPMPDFGLTSAALTRVGDALDADRWLGALSPSPSHVSRAAAEDDEDS